MRENLKDKWERGQAGEEKFETVLKDLMRHNGCLPPNTKCEPPTSVQDKLQGQIWTVNLPGHLKVFP